MMLRRRHNNNNNRVIQRTTSETIRIGEPDIVNHRPSNLPPPHAKKTVATSASFVVTGVSSRVESAACESPDDSEEFSRQTDIETPSFSEDTSYSQYTEDVDYCACEEIILKRCVNAVMPNADEVLAQTNLVETDIDTHHHQTSSPIKIITTSTSTTHIPSPGRFIGRFQVVKVESIHPFRRGRWICHDYVDNSDHAPKDGYEFYRGMFIKRKDLEDIKKRTADEPFIFDPIMGAEQNLQAIVQPVTIVHAAGQRHQLGVMDLERKIALDLQTALCSAFGKSMCTCDLLCITGSIEVTVEACFVVTSCASAVIDTKIEHAMDGIKRHIIFTMRKEVEELNDHIIYLLERIRQLEKENQFLKSKASPEVLRELNREMITNLPIEYDDEIRNEDLEVAAIIENAQNQKLNI